MMAFRFVPSIEEVTKSPIGIRCLQQEFKAASSDFYLRKKVNPNMTRLLLIPGFLS
jgi:hypothetical protein